MFQIIIMIKTMHNQTTHQVQMEHLIQRQIIQAIQRTITNITKLQKEVPQIKLQYIKNFKKI
jgi:hypothetical protein